MKILWLGLIIFALAFPAFGKTGCGPHKYRYSHYHRVVINSCTACGCVFYNRETGLMEEPQCQAENIIIGTPAQEAIIVPESDEETVIVQRPEAVIVEEPNENLIVEQPDTKVIIEEPADKVIVQNPTVEVLKEEKVIVEKPEISIEKIGD